MCTVVIRVPDDSSSPIRILAVRDEDPARPWNPLGTWWGDDVVGVQDRRAGGAWLAARPQTGQLAVLLNRAGEPDVPPESVASRGTLPLDAVRDRPLPDVSRTRGFNLVTIADGTATVRSWDGARMTERAIAPGTHMIAHDDLDDPRTPRIAAWLGAFRDAETASEDWYASWLEVLARSAATPATDDRAIIRDNRPLGIPTLSTLACVASVTPQRVDVRYAALHEAGAWDPLDFS